MNCVIIIALSKTFVKGIFTKKFFYTGFLKRAVSGGKNVRPIKSADIPVNSINAEKVLQGFWSNFFTIRE